MLKIRNVLLPTDGSAWAERTFAHAAYFAGQHGARLHILNVSITRGEMVGTLVTNPPAEVNGFRKELHEAAAESIGVEIVQADLMAKSVEDGIIEYAKNHDIDLVLMATHGRSGIDHVMMGSTSEMVVRLASCPVLTVCPTADHSDVEVGRIIVPVDFSEHAWLATAHAKELARIFKATVHLVHVMEVLPSVGFADYPPVLPDEEMQADTRQALRDLYKESEGPGGPVEYHVEIGHPVTETLGAAKKLDADLMVISTHGRTGLSRMLMGSVAEKMVQKAPCPVFVVKAFGRSLLHDNEAYREPSITERS